MNKHIIRGFLSLFASALMAHAAVAENSATFTLSTPCYYVDNRVTWGDPDFVSGTRGVFVSLESFPATATYYCESDSGYHVAKWVLRTAGLSGNKTIQTWENTSSISISFDYKWAAKYGTALELVVYVDQLSYTLSYDANGGSWTAGEPEGGDYQFSDTVTAPSEESVELDRYKLKGWKSKSGSLIKPGAEFDGDALGITKNGQAVVLYAQWEAETYSYNVSLYVPADAEAKVKGLTMSSSDGDWDCYTTTYTYGKGLTLPNATTSKAGTTFKGWYDNPTYENDPESKIYGKVTKISKTDEGDMEFWGKFETELAIHYDGNGSSKGTMEDQEFTAGKSTSLSRNKFEKIYTVKFNANGGSGTYKDETAEYTFLHWNTKKDGTGDSYEDGQTVTFDESVTLYAQWNPASVAITLPDNPTWSGHTFSGWYTAQKGGTRVYNIETKDATTYIPTGDITLYAHWDGAGSLSEAVGLKDVELKTSCIGGDNVWNPAEDGSYITLAGNTASSTGAKETTILSMEVVGPGTVTFKMKGKDSSNQITLYAGSKLIGTYFVTEDEFGKIYAPDKIPAGSVEVQWRVSGTHKDIHLADITWTPDKEGAYTITAEPSDWAGGTVTGGGEYESGKTATLRAKPKTGWKFIGWRKDGAVVSTENPYEVTVTANATYTAVLADAWYYISYNKNGGTGTTMSKQLAVRDQPTKLNANTYTKTGYVFNGWNTAKDGSGTAYADQATVTDNLALSGSTATLYAQWKSGSEEEKEEKEEQEEEEKEVLPEPGPYASAVGEAVSVDLAADCAGWTIKSVSGLPTGLKYNKATGLVTGTPTKAVSKEDNVTITFSDKTKVKATWTVEALPAMMVGTYYGAATVSDGMGQFQLKLTAAGKATGYFYAAGKKTSFKSTALTEDGDGYAVTVTYTYSGTKYADEILLSNVATVEGVDVWSATIVESDVLEDLDARRDTIKECFGKVVSKAMTYDVIEKTEDGEYLKSKVTTAGAVKVSGKLLNDAGKLTSVSCSTHLVVGDEGVPYCYITIYKTVSKSEPIVYEERWELPE